MFVPFPSLGLDPEEKIPAPDYSERMFGSDQVEAAFRRWYDKLVSDYDDDLESPPEVAEDVIKVLDDAGLLEYSKVHLTPADRFYNQLTAAEVAFILDADIAHDSRKIECHLNGGDGYVGIVALMVRLRNHPGAQAWREDPEGYAKWIGRNIRGAYEHYHELFRALIGMFSGDNPRLSNLLYATLSYADSYPHFYSGLVKKIGRSTVIRPYEIIADVGPNHLHFLLRTSDKDIA
jgi:hypothetical protein